jgi:hypothetical protein
MKSSRLLRTIAVVGVMMLILAAFIGPADARKKKRKHRRPPVPCAVFTPWEKAADAPKSIVTDAATKDAPVTVKVPTEAGAGSSTPESEDAPEQGSPTHSWYNVQVDSKAHTANLYVTLEFPGNTDYDLYLRNGDGSSDTYSAGAPPYTVPGTDGTGHGGHSEGDPTAASENIDGVAVNDCQGFSVDIVSSSTLGGEVTLKFWLGGPPA